MKQKRHIALALFAFIAMGANFDAKADIVATANNQSNGKIVLTDESDTDNCGDKGLRAMTVAPNDTPTMGCWRMLEDMLFILWDDESTPRNYDTNIFTIVKKDDAK
jgi:hypothetical protein